MLRQIFVPLAGLRFGSKITPNRNGVPAAKVPTGTPFRCVPAHLHPCISYHTIKWLDEAGIEALASGRKFSLRLHLKTVVSRKVVSYILRGQCNKVTIIYFNIKRLKSTLSGTNDQNPLFDDVISRSKQFAMSPLTFCKKTHCSRKKNRKT